MNQRLGKIDKGFVSDQSCPYSIETEKLSNPAKDQKTKEKVVHKAIVNIGIQQNSDFSSFPINR